MTRTLLRYALVLLLFVSCNKEATVYTRAEYLTTGKWYLKQATVWTKVADQSYSYNMVSLMEDCMDDNATIFNQDGTITIDDGLRKCDQKDKQQVAAGNWQLLNNDSELQTIIAGLPVTVHIKELDQYYLKLEWESTYQNLPAAFCIVYSHKN